METVSPTNFQHNNKQYLLKYRSLPYIVGFVLSLFTLVFGTLILVLAVSVEDIESVFRDPDFMSSFLFITIALAYLAVALVLFILPKYIKSCSHKHAWYLCFQEETININFRHCRYLSKLSSHHKTILPISASSINWIRKAVFYSLDAGKFDIHYIDICLNENDWKKAHNLAIDELSRMHTIKANEQDFVFDLRDNHIIRIRTDFFYWPEPISETWNLYKYKTCKDYTIPFSEAV